MNKRNFILGIIGTVLVWCPIIYANIYGYVPLILVGLFISYIYLLTMMLSISITTILSVKYYIGYYKKKEHVNKSIFVIILPNMIYLIFGTHLYWLYYTF